MAVYPTALVTTANIANAGANLSTNPHSDLHDDMRDEIVAIEAELGIAPSSSYSTVAARLNTGWQHIGSGNVSAAVSFTVTIPASTYWKVRVTMDVAVASGPQTFQCRVNSDSTAALHRYAFASPVSDAVTTTTTTGTSWHVATVSNFSGNVLEVEIYDTLTSTQLPFKALGVAYSSVEADCRQAIFGGSLASARLLSSLLFFPAASTVSGHWLAEGYRIS